MLTRNKRIATLEMKIKELETLIWRNQDWSRYEIIRKENEVLKEQIKELKDAS